MNEAKNQAVPPDELRPNVELKAEPTPRPWRVQHEVERQFGGAYPAVNHWRLYSEVSGPNFHAGDAQSEANAEFIVRAVNAHEALVEALSLIVPRCYGVNRESCGKAAVAEGGFGLKFCYEHRGDCVLIAAWVKAAAALALAATQPASATKGESLTFHDAVRIARGCTDYGGGHHSDGKMDAYQHGIQTVINALELAEKDGLGNYQTRVLHCIGAQPASAVSGDLVDTQE